MTATVHALVGASIASHIPIPGLAIVIAFISHFLLDKVPHWDAMTNKATKTKQRILVEVIIDYILGYALIVLLAPIFWPETSITYMWVVAFFSQLPDTLEAPYILTKQKIILSYQVYQVQHWFHDVGFNARMNAPWGVITQVVTVAIFLLWSFI